MTLHAESLRIHFQQTGEVAAVHEEVLLGEAVPEAGEVQAGEGVDEEDLAIDQELQQAEAGLVVVHVVGLGIEGDLIHAIERREQRGELVLAFDELVGG